jgi:hypothetical protein
MKGEKKDFEGGRIVYSLPEETKENHVKPQYSQENCHYTSILY